MNLRVKLSIGALALLFGAQNGLASAVNPTVIALPRGTVQLSRCIAGMGEHWARPRDFPFGPVYGVHNGKLVFTEVMIDQRAFELGKSSENILKPPDGYAIDHVDIEFIPHGHAHYPIPHYDIHAYFVPHSEHIAYCQQRGHTPTAH